MPKPAAPSGLAVAAVSSSRIDLTWTDTSSGATGFRIERALRGESYATIATLPAGSTNYSDTALAANTRYYYRIRAVNAAGVSAASEPARTATLPESQPPASTEPPAPPPPAPPPPAPPLKAIESPGDQLTSAELSLPQGGDSTMPGELNEATQRMGEASLETEPESAVKAVNTQSTLSTSSSLPASPAPSHRSLPIGWSTTDVGPCAGSEHASYAGDSFTLRGAGTDIWGKSDGFCFVYHPLDGDGQIVARVLNLPRADLLAKAGIMIRETLAANSIHVGLFVTPAAGLRFLRRREIGGATTNAVKTDNRAIFPPCWLKLERSNDTITAYHSRDGNSWQVVGAEAIALKRNIYVGLAVTAQVRGMSDVSIFDNVSVLPFKPF
jgi:hypothetical protein